jgi:hypothetical protein
MLTYHICVTHTEAAEQRCRLRYQYVILMMSTISIKGINVYWTVVWLEPVVLL